MFSKKVKKAQYHDAYETDIVFLPCIYCFRTFNPESLKRHQPICYKNQIRQKRREKLLKNEKNVKPYVFDGDVLDLNELLGNKNQRRGLWRRDHKHFVKEIESIRDSRSSALNSSPNTMENVKNIESPESYNNSTVQLKCKKNFQEKKHQSSSNSVSGSLDSVESISSIVEENNHQSSKSLFPKLLRNRKKSFPNLQQGGFIDDSCISTLSYKPPQKLPTEKNNNRNSGKNHKTNNCTALQQLFESFNSDKKTKELKTKENSRSFTTAVEFKRMKRVNSNYELRYKNVDNMRVIDALKNYKAENNKETENYLKHISKVIDFYKRNYWDKEEINSKSRQLTVMEDIPKNISVHRKRLERLKQISKSSNKETWSPILQKSGSNKQLDRQNQMHSVSPTESKPGSKLVRFVRDTATGSDSPVPEISMLEDKDTSRRHGCSSLHNQNCCLQHGIPPYDEQPRSILKSTENRQDLELIPVIGALPTNTAKSQNNNFRVKPYVNPKLQRFKQHFKQTDSEENNITHLDSTDATQISTDVVSGAMIHSVSAAAAPITNTGDTNNHEGCSCKCSKVNNPVTDAKVPKLKEKPKLVVAPITVAVPVSSCAGVNDEAYKRAWKIEL